MENLIESSRTGHDLGNRICEKIMGKAWSDQIKLVLHNKLGPQETGSAVERRHIGCG